MRIILISILFIYKLLAIDIPSAESDPNKNINTLSINKFTIFGSNLFNGQFSVSTLHRYNPNYILNVGDVINIKLWGAFEQELKLSIDNQGNIFIPKIGVVKLLGIKNSDMTDIIKDKIVKIYKKNLELYASLENFQPIEVFISGAVKKPGLYRGLSSDSILQFLDKADGIGDNGSFRFINVIRDGKIIYNVDLYEYLIYGKLNLVQFQNGDVINVEYLKDYIKVDGDCKEPLQIELKDDMNIDEIIKIAGVYSSVTDIEISNFKDNQLNKRIYNILSKDIVISSRDNIKFISNNYIDTLNITITGEHIGAQNIVVDKGTSLKDLVESIEFTKQSDKKNINLYRKSVAKLQKELLLSNLKELEATVLKTGSTTTDEANIRRQEASLVLNFIDRAKKVEPKGRVILHSNSDLSKVILEDQDTIFIPKINHIVTVSGDVKIPSALTFVNDMSFEEYIDMCGGLSASADEENMLVIHQNGKVTKYDDSIFSTQNLKIDAGDSILVLGKSDSKNLQIAKDLTQVIYQIAVSAGVLIGL